MSSELYRRRSGQDNRHDTVVDYSLVLMLSLRVVCFLGNDTANLCTEPTHIKSTFGMLPVALEHRDRVQLTRQWNFRTVKVFARA